MMMQARSTAAILLAALLAMGAASPFVAQASDQGSTAINPRMVHVLGRGNVLVQPVSTNNPRAVPRLVIVPGVGEVYIVPVGPVDTRTSRQRCVDKEIANIGGFASPLAQSVIDLKCSQR
jgi:hypothetical protein